MTDPFTGYYIPITHIHDWSLYWLFTSLLHIYMTSPFTGYLHPIESVMYMCNKDVNNQLRDQSCICVIGI
jgi:hypothetical protein